MGLFVKACAFALFIVCSVALANSDVRAQSYEAWRYAAVKGARHVPALFSETERGLVCEQTHERSARLKLEVLAEQEGAHPAQIAEEITVYLWSDWSLFYVSGYDLQAFLGSAQSAPAFGAFLDTLYKEHHACLLAAVRVLVAGYEGHYLQEEDGRYVYDRTTEADPYKLYALDPVHFPGTGIFEPLGIVYMSRYADLLKVGWIRQQVIGHFAAIIERRSAEGNPLRLAR